MKTHNKWDNTLPPIDKVRSGDEIELECKDASDGQITPTSTSEDLKKVDVDRIHPLTGPIEVENAEPGDAIEIEFLEFEDKGWGWTAVIPDFGIFADERFLAPTDFTKYWLKIWKVKDGFATAKLGDIEVEVPINPFPGVVGVALPYRGKYHTLPPRENGGNLDIKHLNKGSKILLPVFVKGAMFSIGDTHLAQGDGEICGPALEAPLKIKARIKLHKQLGLTHPIILTKGVNQPYKEYIAVPGIDSNLMQATKKAVKGVINILSKYMTPAEACMLSSVILDLKISEIVNIPNYVVTAYLPKDPLKIDIF